MTWPSAVHLIILIITLPIIPHFPSLSRHVGRCSAGISTCLRRYMHKRIAALLPHLFFCLLRLHAWMVADECSFPAFVCSVGQDVFAVRPCAFASAVSQTVPSFSALGYLSFHPMVYSLQGCCSSYSLGDCGMIVSARLACRCGCVLRSPHVLLVLCSSVMRWCACG
jgi:hypothetical protein